MFGPIPHLPTATEQMDDPRRPPADFLAVEVALDRINFLSGSFLRTAQWLRLAYQSHDLSATPFSFLDVGCGGGGLLRYLYRFSLRQNMQVQFFGIDPNERLLDIARSKSAAVLSSKDKPAIQFSAALLESTTEKYTLIYSNLVLHHLLPSDIGSFLTTTRARAEKVRHEDLIRSHVGLAMASIVPRALTRSSVVHHDAQASVYRSYSMSEWTAQAHATGYSAKHIFPERIQLEANP